MMQQILKKYRCFVAILGLFSLGICYLEYTQNKEVFLEFQTEVVEFEEADLEGFTPEIIGFSLAAFGILFIVVFNTPINVLFRRLNEVFTQQTSESLRLVGYFIRFHQIKIGF